MAASRKMVKSHGALPRTRGRLQAGDRLRRHTIIARLGSGAQGEVYDAYDPMLDRRVAVKILTSHGPKDAEARHRMHREAQALARLDHPNILPIFDFGEIGDALFLVTERLRGTTLSAWMRVHTDPGNWPAVLEIMRQAGRGLVAAHSMGLVHRDFKPDNIFVTDSGRAIVLDFGLVRVAPTPAAMTGEVRESSGLDVSDVLRGAPGAQGTPRFMAPELHRGGSVDPRSDQFAFCVTLFFALYRTWPFAEQRRERPQELSESSRVTRPEDDRGVPRWLQRVVHRGLAPVPERRFASMHELLERLESPRPHRRWIAALAVSGVLGGSTMLVGAALERDPCAIGERVLDAPPAAPTVEHVARALATTGAAHGIETADLTRVALQGYRHRWLEGFEGSCKLGRRHEPGHDRVLDRQMSCLERARSAYVALSRQLANADSKMVSRAIAAIEALPPPELCGDIDALHEAQPVPADLELRRRVEQLRDSLAKNVTRVHAGQYRSALARLRKLEPTVFALDYGPLRAEWRGALAGVLARMGRADSALFHARISLTDAVRSRHDLAGSTVFTDALVLQAHRMNDLADGMDRLREAEARVRRAGDPAKSLRNLWDAHGIVYGLRGEHVLSERAFRVALEVYDRYPELSSSGRTITAGNLAVALHSQRQYPAAIALNRHNIATIERELGHLHPNLISAYGNLGSALITVASFRPARDAYLRAQTICAVHHGPEHVDCAFALNGLVSAHLRLGETRRAGESLDRLERLQTRAKQRGGQVLTWADARRAAMHLAAGDYEAARRWALRAIERFEGERFPNLDLWIEARAHLGIAAAGSGDLEEARRQRRTLTRLVEKRGAGHLETSPAFWILEAVHWRALGETSRSLECFARALSLFTTVAHRSSPIAVRFELMYATALCDAGQCSAAGRRLERLEAELTQHVGKRAPYLAEVRGVRRMLAERSRSARVNAIVDYGPWP